MNLATKYLGLNFKNPLIAGASPLTATHESIKELEDAGVAGVVLHSLFEEQINHDLKAIDRFLFQGSESYAEALSYLPESEYFESAQGEHYLEELQNIKRSVDIPIIASLNGVSSGGWIKYAKKLEQAGADALELNITYIPTDACESARVIEKVYKHVVEDVAANITIPLSVKMNPYFTNPAAMAESFQKLGASGLVIFDNPIKVDINLDELSPIQSANLTTSASLSETLRWCAILHGNVKVSIAASTGIHSAKDILKAIMSGADVTYMVSALLKNGASHATLVLKELTEWMEEKEYESIEQMKGSISLNHTDNKAAYERTSYMKALMSYRD